MGTPAETPNLDMKAVARMIKAMPKETIAAFLGGLTAEQLGGFAKMGITMSAKQIAAADTTGPEGKPDGILSEQERLTQLVEQMKSFQKDLAANGDDTPSPEAQALMIGRLKALRDNPTQFAKFMGQLNDVKGVMAQILALPADNMKTVIGKAINSGFDLSAMAGIIDDQMKDGGAGLPKPTDAHIEAAGAALAAAKITKIEPVDPKNFKDQVLLPMIAALEEKGKATPAK